MGDAWDASLGSAKVCRRDLYLEICPRLYVSFHLVSTVYHLGKHSHGLCFCTHILGQAAAHRRKQHSHCHRANRWQDCHVHLPMHTHGVHVLWYQRRCERKRWVSALHFSSYTPCNLPACPGHRMQRPDRLEQQTLRAGHTGRDLLNFSCSHFPRQELLWGLGPQTSLWVGTMPLFSLRDIY